MINSTFKINNVKLMKKLMRDPFELLLKKVRAGEFITPAFFHKCTIPHSYHCFQRYHFRPDPFDQYMKKHKVPLRAPTATQLHKMTLSALSRLAKSGSAGVSPAVLPQVSGPKPAASSNSTFKINNSKLFSSPSEFSFSSVAKPARSFRASAVGGTVKLRLAVDHTQTAQPSNCHPGRACPNVAHRAKAEAGIQFAANLKLKTKNSKLNKSLHALQVLHGEKLNSQASGLKSQACFAKSNPKLDNCKTCFSKVPDT